MKEEEKEEEEKLKEKQKKEQKQNMRPLRIAFRSKIWCLELHCHCLDLPGEGKEEARTVEILCRGKEEGEGGEGGGEEKEEK